MQRLQLQTQPARARSSSDLIIRSLTDVPRAEKILLAGLSASFIVSCLGAPGATFLAFATVASYFGIFKPNQDKLVKEYFEDGLGNYSYHNGFYRPPRLLEISNEISTFSGDPKAYPELGPNQGCALHNACVLQMF